MVKPAERVRCVVVTIALSGLRSLLSVCTHNSFTACLILSIKGYKLALIRFLIF